MTASDLDDRAIRQILETAKTVAVVGLSDKPDRESYKVAKYLQEHGYRIIPVNPTVGEVLGEKSYASVTDIPGRVDVVDVFRKPEAVAPVAQEAIDAGAGTLWMQLGVVNQEAADTAEAAGLQVVMDHCMKMEHERLLG
ncbi:MAG: CoA-binding protein [Nitrososphaerales archaeon]